MDKRAFSISYPYLNNSCNGNPFFCCLFGFLVGITCPAPSHSVEPSLTETVATRNRPELNPLGQHLGGFLAFPSLTVTAQYDDNIFATETDKQSSYISRFSPRVSTRSDWQNHELQFFASADIVRHSDFASENYEDWKVASNAKLDVRQNAHLFGGIGFSQDHVDRTAPDEASGLVPTRFDNSSLFTRYLHKLNRLSLEIQLDFNKKDFYDVKAIRNGAPVLLNQDDRDRTEYGIGLRTDYELQNNVTTFVNITGNYRDYDELEDFTGVDRSSKGYLALVGLSPTLSNVIFGDFYFGYRHQNYESPLANIGTPVFGGLINWNVTTLTTISLDLKPSVQETTNSEFSGYISKELRARVDHELRRDILLATGANFIRTEYEGHTSVEREETLSNLFLCATYMINRHLRISGQYDYVQRTGSGDVFIPDGNSEFEKNLFLLQLQALL